jgi:hypothetical protein
MASYQTYLVEQVRNAIQSRIKNGCVCCIEQDRWDEVIREAVENYCDRFGIALEPRVEIEESARETVKAS